MTQGLNTQHKVQLCFAFLWLWSYGELARRKRDSVVGVRRGVIQFLSPTAVWIWAGYQLIWVCKIQRCLSTSKFCYSKVRWLHWAGYTNVDHTSKGIDTFQGKGSLMTRLGEVGLIKPGQLGYQVQGHGPAETSIHEEWPGCLDYSLILSVHPTMFIQTPSLFFQLYFQPPNQNLIT